MTTHSTYYETASPEEIKNIQDKLSFYEKDRRIIICQASEHITVASSNILFDIIEDMTKDMDEFALIINAPKTKIPGPKVRRALRERITACHKLIHRALCIPNNPIVLAALKISLHRLGKKRTHSIVHTQEQGIQNALQKLTKT